MSLAAELETHPKILIREQGRAGIITLDSSISEQALDVEVCRVMMRTLLNWMHDDTVDLVIVDRSDKARNLCAGAAAMNLSLSSRTIGLSATPYLETYAQLCYLVSTYPKPYVALIDGATAGEGLGVSLLGSYQVATERAAISFAETGYGSVMHAGASFYLPKLKSELGTWLALTGSRLNGADARAIALTSHYCPKQDLAELRRALINRGVEALNKYRSSPEFSLEEHLNEIELAFAGDCANRVRKRLERGSVWAKQQATKFNSKSPLSTKISLRLLRTGHYLDSVREALKVEYRILSRLVLSSNFKEGVRAVYEDKDHWPIWQPSNVSRVDYDMVSRYFSPLRDGELHLPEFHLVTGQKFEEEVVHA